MPELPEVETVRRGLAPVMEQQRIVSVQLNRPDLRIPLPEHMAETLEGSRIRTIGRRAKYLLFHLDNGQVLLAHLGMSGRMLLMPKADYSAHKHDHVLWDLENGIRFVFQDPRRFGLMTLCDEAALDAHTLLAHLGPEPLGNHFNADYLRERLASKKVAIKPALMDQQIVVGVGNIYASEALFLAGVHPSRPANKVKKELDALVEAIQKVLQSAIDSGGSTLRDYVRSSGEMGYFQHCFAVYGRQGEPCQRCGNPIEKYTQIGRSTFFCGVCQPKKAR
ncbi:MAG: DNA-formamidopyrimidine glycosylase [Rickettsiales bacterium]|nr:DNA-formamidopyrimidine glycosylase [Rickettsiales bacterium]